MPGRDLPDLEEHLRRLPAVVAVEAPAGMAERIARRGRRRRRLRRAAAAAVAVGLVGGVVATRAAVLDRTPAPVLDPGLVVRDATPERLAGGRWRALPPLPPGRLARRSGAAVVWTGRQLIVWGASAVTPSGLSPTAPPTTRGRAAGSCSRPPRRASGCWMMTGSWCGPAARCWCGAA
jgi:hypothetical protein